MTLENELVIKDIVESIRKLVHAVAINSQEMRKHYGITGRQCNILRSLYINGPTSSADLSRRLYVTPSNITGIIDRLEKKGFVSRVKKEGDRRIALITLTESGAELSRSIPDSIENKMISELADLDTEHVKFLAMAMKQILKTIYRKDIAIPPSVDPILEDLSIVSQSHQ